MRRDSGNPDYHELKIAVDLAAISPVRDENTVFYVDESGELAVLTSIVTDATGASKSEKLEATLKNGPSGPVKVSKTIKSIGAIAYDEDGIREVRVFYADELNVLRELCHSYKLSSGSSQWKAKGPWKYGSVGREYIFHLAETTSISATIAQRTLSDGTYKYEMPVVEIFYTDAATPDSISCAAVTLQKKNGETVRAWEGRKVGPKPADHVERFDKEKPASPVPLPQPTPAPQPTPTPRPTPPQPTPGPPNHELFTHYHVSIALGFGFFFGLVAGIVLDRPFYGHYYHHSGWRV